MIVLDSSAVLAVIRSEPGADYVIERAINAAISAVNHSEIIATVLEKGGDLAEARRELRRLRLEIVPFDAVQAERVGELRPLTKALGLSLGDRACLALAEKLGAKVLTADKPWSRLQLGVEIELIR